jgi:hypothetical protein
MQRGGVPLRREAVSKYPFRGQSQRRDSPQALPTVSDSTAPVGATSALAAACETGCGQNLCLKQTGSCQRTRESASAGASPRQTATRSAQRRAAV